MKPLWNIHSTWVGFVSAGELQAGDIIRTSDGRKLPIKKIEIEELEETVTVYNFEVEDFHTYYVSELGVLEHNECPVKTETVKPSDGVVREGGSSSWNGDKEIYSVIYEVELPKSMYPDVSDRRHFQEANKQLYEVFKENPEFAQQMEAMYPGIIKGVQPGKKGAFSRLAPTKDVTWHHHPERVGILQLIPKYQHRAKGAIQKKLHPNGKGGMENWGGGR